MIIPFDSLSSSKRYHLMTQTVVPRPIAWVLSENDDGGWNLAPFSYFNALCSDPPLLMFSLGKKPSGEIKDTRRNILSGRDCVVHIPSVEHAALVSASAETLAYEDSEIDKHRIDLVEFEGCALPRLRDARVAYHCRFYDSHDIGPEQQCVIYVEIVSAYIDDELITEHESRLVVDAKRFRPLLRLGGANYAELGDVFSVARPC